MPIDHLVVDSSAFIHHGPIRETGKNLYSCEEAIAEIKDAATLESLRSPQYELKLAQVDTDDFNICCEFAKKTGDYRQLSVVDLKLITITYSLEKRFNGSKYIISTPKEVVVGPNTRPKNQLMVKPDKCVAMEVEKEDENDDDEDDEEEDEDEAGWITPQNVESVYKKMGYDKAAAQSEATAAQSNDRITVACMTSDFSMQNCLLQMGLLVISPVDGLMIKEAKRIVLRCHACFKVYPDPSKIKNDFCPHCGNLDTLKRVQYVIDKNGEKRVLVNFKRPIKVKGTNQQLPRPRGGKHANNPLLAPDQRVRRDKQDKFTVTEKKTVNAEHILHDPAYLVRTNPFAYRNCKKGKK